MIPFTLASFMPGDGDSKRNYILEAFLYSLGIILTFSVLGVSVSLLFGATGITKLATNPYLNLAMGVFFLIFAVFLWGAKFMSPAWMSLLSTYLDKNFTGYSGIMAKGLIISLTTFTCTMPFVGSVLVTAAGGEWFFPFLGMVSYGFAFSIPFVFLAMFPGIYAKFPRTGNWNIKFRGVLAILEVIASLKFFSNADLVWSTGILPRNTFILISILLIFFMILYILDIVHSPDEIIKNESSPGLVQYAFGILLIMGIVFLSRGLEGKKLGILEAYLPPENSTDSEKISWISTLEEGKKLSMISGKPILINFTGWSCSNCRWMEANILNQAEIREELKKFILVELYTDGDDPVEEKNQEYLIEKFKTFGVPFYAALDLQENILSQHEGTGTLEEFKSFLKRAQ